jgi:hypothetical protein
MHPVSVTTRQIPISGSLNIAFLFSVEPGGESIALFIIDPVPRFAANSFARSTVRVRLATFFDEKPAKLHSVLRSSPAYLLWAVRRVRGGQHSVSA